MCNFIVIFAANMKDLLIENIICGLQDAKAKDIQVIDMTEIEEAAFTHFVICEGSSSTHVYGIANSVMDYVRDNFGQKHQGSVGLTNRQWIAIDYGYVLVHIFLPETRSFYRLESLWEDAEITRIPDLD